MLYTCLLIKRLVCMLKVLIVIKVVKIYTRRDKIEYREFIKRAH